MCEINCDRIDEIMRKDVDSITESLKDSLKDLSLDNIIDLVPQLIKTVEKYKDLKGKEKKQLVIELINHFIDVTDGFGDDEVLDPILKRIVPSVIDNMVKVDKKDLKFKKMPLCLNLFKRCKKA